MESLLRSRTRRVAAPIVLACLAATANPQSLRQVVDLIPTPGIGSMDRTALVAPGLRPGEVFLTLDDGVHGIELWRSDGTAAGTSLVVDLAPGPADSSIEWVLVHGFDAWFTNGQGQQTELWRSDGTANGTHLVFTAGAFAANSITAPLAFLPNGDFFIGLDDVLARSDGTVAGTQSLGMASSWLIELNGAWYARSVVTGDVHRTDGTVAGTSLVATGVDAISPGLGGIVARRALGAGSTMFQLLGVPGTPQITVPEDVVFATAGDGLTIVGTTTLWYWTGGASAQVLGTFASLVDPATWVTLVPRRDGSGMVFMADDGVHGFEPWWTDYTAAGTHLLADLNPGPTSTLVHSMFGAGDRVMFWATTPTLGSEPWSTDGTTAGTVLVGDLEPGVNGSYPDIFSAAGAMLTTRRIVFPIQTSATGFEMWITDGTPAGTRLLADVNPGPASSTGFGFWGWAAGTSLIYAADDGTHGREPYALDLDGAVTPLFVGCPDATARYLVYDPVIGTAWQLGAIGLANFGVAVLSQPSPALLDVGEMCSFVLDPTTSVVLAAMTPDPAGRWSATWPIPNNPSLRGLDFVTQAAQLDPSRPLGVELLGGYWLTVGF